MSYRTTKDLIAQHEMTVRKNKARISALLDTAERSGRSMLTEAEDQAASRLMDEVDIANGKLAELRQIEADDAESDRLSREVHPIGTAARGRETVLSVSEPMPGGAPGGRVSNGLSQLESEPVWTRASDGKKAALSRSERFAEHDVVRAEMERNADRDKIIVGQHGDFGQYLRSMTTSGASAIVPTVWSANIIDRARNAAVIFDAGATLVPMDAKTVQIGRLTADPAPAYKTEGSPVTAGDMTYDYVQLTAASLTALVVTSLEFLQDAPSASESIQNALGAAMALELDKAAFFGQLGANGTNDEGAAYGLASPYPKGILKNLSDNAPGNIIGTFPTNGTAQTAATPWNELLAVYYKPLRSNEKVTAIVSNIALQQQYNGMYDVQYNPIRMPNVLANTPWLTTNAIPSFTRGTMTSRATDVFAGDFSQVLIGQRLGLEVRVLTERYAENGQVGLLAYYRGDVQVARPAALACYRAIQGAL